MPLFFFFMPVRHGYATRYASDVYADYDDVYFTAHIDDADFFFFTRRHASCCCCLIFSLPIYYAAGAISRARVCAQYMPPLLPPAADAPCLMRHAAAMPPLRFRCCCRAYTEQVAADARCLRRHVTPIAYSAHGALRADILQMLCYADAAMRHVRCFSRDDVAPRCCSMLDVSTDVMFRLR